MSEYTYSILQYCGINKGAVFKNGKAEFDLHGLSFEKFIEASYRHCEIDYPKFYKMDNLSKLGFVTSETLLKGLSLKKIYKQDRIGVILSNKSSCLDTDVKYYNMVAKGVASPAIFVYTLPNIMIGEICIRNEIKGENTFFVSDKYEIHSQVSYVNSLLNTGVIDACICGWVELMNETYESFLYLVVKGGDNNQLQHTTENIETLYNQISN